MLLTGKAHSSTLLWYFICILLCLLLCFVCLLPPSFQYSAPFILVFEVGLYNPPLSPLPTFRYEWHFCMYTTHRWKSILLLDHSLISLLFFKHSIIICSNYVHTTYLEDYNWRQGGSDWIHAPFFKHATSSLSSYQQFKLQQKRAC